MPHCESMQLLSNPSSTQRTAADGFVPLLIIHAPGHDVKLQKPLQNTLISSDTNLMRLNLRINYHPAVIVCEYNPLWSYCAKREAEGSGHPKLLWGFVKVREHQGPRASNSACKHGFT